MSLIINNITISDIQGFQVTQTLKPVRSRTVRRLQNGAAVSMSNFRKLETTITGSGFYPAGLDAIDWDAAVSIHCVQRQAISSASNIIALPTNRRVDAGYTPDSGAFVGGDLVPSPVSIEDHVATITAVSGATGYLIQYFPVLSVFADLDVDEDIDGRVIRWTIRGDET